MVLHHHSALSLSLIIRGAASRGVVSRHLLWVEGQGFAMAAQAGGEALVVPRWLPVAVRPGTSLADRNPTVLGLIRVIVLAAVLLDSTAILVEPRATWSALGDVAQTALGIVTIAAVLWTRWRPALAGALVLVAVVSVRGHETGVEVLVFMIALVVSVAVGTPRLAIGFALLSVVPVVLPTTAPGLDARLQGWALLGALSVMVGLLARAMLGWERSAAVQLASQREDTARARERVRGELAVDVGAVVTHALTTTERTLSALPREASMEQLRAAMDVIEQDARAALRALRLLLGILDEATEQHEPPPGAEDPPPRSLRLAEWLGSVDARRSGAAVAVLGALSYALTADEQRAGAMGALCLLTLAVVAVLPGLGWWAVVAMTALGTVFPDPGWVGPVCAVVLTAYAVISHTTGRAVTAIVGTAALCSARVLAGDAADSAILTVVGAAVASTAGLWFVTHVRSVRSLRNEAVAARRQEAQITRDERRGVAHELHDVIGHELSVITLRTLQVHGSTDPEELRGALTAIAETVRATRTVLARYVAELGRPAASNGLPEDSFVRLSSAAGSLAGTLEEGGIHVTLTLEPGVDEADEVLQRAMGRVLTEAVTNVLRHAPARASCAIRLTTGDERLRLTVRSDLGAPRMGLSTGRGLRGIEERAHMLGGTARSGPTDGRWELSVELPQVLTAA